METAKISIRYANAADSTRLAELGARTFEDAFGADNTPESMAAFLISTFGPGIQAAELADPSVVFLLAEVDRTAIGYAKLREGTEVGIKGDAPLEVAQIYTLRAWQGRRVGGALMQASLEEARLRGHDVLWLGVWEHNPRARAFYRKWGFVDVGVHDFMLGDDRQTDILMQRAVA